MSSQGNGKAKVTAEDDGPPKDDKNRGGARNRFRHKSKQKPLVFRNTTMGFEGECEELKGSIYDCPDGRSPNQYVKTKRFIAGYAAKKYIDGGKIR
jgi:hypothetical protein